ncbi:MAG: hypothetical protein E7813_02140, partial [Bradyrhizobium sp.]
MISKESFAGILPPDGESWRRYRERTLNCVQPQLERYPGANIRFVAHDAVLQSLSERPCRNGLRASTVRTPESATRRANQQGCGISPVNPVPEKYSDFRKDQISSYLSRPAPSRGARDRHG